MSPYDLLHWPEGEDDFPLPYFDGPAQACERQAYLPLATKERNLERIPSLPI